MSKKANDQSMDDILASIRKIISNDPVVSVTPDTPTKTNGANNGASLAAELAASPAPANGANLNDLSEFLEPAQSAATAPASTTAPATAPSTRDAAAEITTGLPADWTYEAERSDDSQSLSLQSKLASLQPTPTAAPQPEIKLGPVAVEDAPAAPSMDLSTLQPAAAAEPSVRTSTAEIPSETPSEASDVPLPAQVPYVNGAAKGGQMVEPTLAAPDATLSTPTLETVPETVADTTSAPDTFDPTVATTAVAGLTASAAAALAVSAPQTSTKPAPIADPVPSVTEEIVSAQAAKPLGSEAPVAAPLSANSADAAAQIEPLPDTPTQAGTVVLGAGKPAPDVAETDAKNDQNAEVGDVATTAPPEKTNQALESIVVKALQPMLQSWLDDNLPRLVEQRLEEEIAKRHAANSNE